MLVVHELERLITFFIVDAELNSCEFLSVVEMEQVEGLEKELEEAKRKLAQISSYLETRRKQKIMGRQIGKFE